MSEETKINQPEDNTTIGGQSKGGDESRSKTSMMIAIMIVPFILLATISVYVLPGWIGTIFDAYNIFFNVVLLLGLLYCIHELVNFISPSSESYRKYLILMVTSSLIFALPFGIEIWNSIFELVAINFLVLNFNTLYLVLLLLLIGVIYLVMSDIEFKDSMLVLFTSMLFYGFFTAFSYFTTSGGWETIFLFILLVVVSDSMAYYGGKKYGTKKIFPNISPSKSYEGFWIGLFSAITFGIVWFVIVFVGLGSIGDIIGGTIYTGSQIYWLLLIIIAVAAVAPFGDLYFSKIKRTYNKKDFSNLLPGHGGLLDRIDSHIFAMCAATILTHLII